MSWMNASMIADLDARDRAERAVEPGDRVLSEEEVAVAVAAQAAADAEKHAAARAACDAERAAFLTYPLVADSGVRVVEDMDESGNCRWVSAAVFSAKYPTARVVGREAKCAPHGFGFRV